MGGRPSKGTAADRRLAATKKAPAKKAAAAPAAKLKFGSPAWNLKYGITKKGKK